MSLKHLSQDIPAGLVVFLVALPLCLGIALASGAPLFSGLIAGIVGGIVVGAISNSRIGVSGPAAGLTVIVLTAIETHGYPAFLAAVVIAGVMQILFGIMRGGIIGYYFPSAVIKGMLAAIGLILILKQIPHAVGYDKDPEGDMEFLQADQQNTFSELLVSWENYALGAAIISVLSLLILIVWDKKIKGKYSIAKLLPGALIVVVMGAGLNHLFSIFIPALSLSSEHLVNVPSLLGNNAGDLFILPDFSAIGTPALWLTAFTLAVVASLETLLCVEATDKLDPEKHNTSMNRELLAQGVGNMFSGAIGGLPVTQVIVRSTANLDAGARTKASAIFHGILLVLSIVLIPFLLNKIPLAALAAVLLMVGYKLADVALFKRMYKLGYTQWVPFIVTVLAILFTDLLIGIVIGLGVALYFILRKNMQTDHITIREKAGDDHVFRIVLSEEISFLNKVSLKKALQQMETGCTVIIDGSKTNHIPFDIYELISDFEIISKDKGITLKTQAITEDKIE
jgi:MFS superfamily sulfate permease-like transporter